MTTISKSNDTYTAITTSTTAPRATAPTKNEVFRESLKKVGVGLFRGIEAASGFAPGGSALTSALRATGSAASAFTSTAIKGAASAQSPGEANVNARELLASGDDMNPMDLIQLQRAVSLEQLNYSTVSNVMKAKHDSAKNAANNMR
ncbi:MAG: hypothetical protein R3A47_00705 [Polyangiales bacterium]